MPEKRFILVDRETAIERGYHDPEYMLEGYDWYDYASYLVDTKTNTVLFCDATEPEDATLDRTFRPLVDLLNEVASGE